MASERDHHIYIHYKGDGGGSKKTSPKKNKANKNKIGEDNEFKKFNNKLRNVMSTVKNPTGKALDKLTSSVPVVATIFAVAQILESLVQTGVDVYGAYTGDYNVSYEYSNFKKGMSWVLDPVSNGFSAYRQLLDYRGSGLGATQQTLLSANTINNITLYKDGRKV